MEPLYITKQNVQEILDKYPDIINVEDFINEVILIAKIETAQEQFANGEYLTSKELDDEMKKW
jgi:hypothetical protein